MAHVNTRINRHVVVVQDHMSSLRRRMDDLTRAFNAGMELVDASDHKDHFYGEAGHLMKSFEDGLSDVQDTLDKMAFILNDLDNDTLADSMPTMEVTKLKDSVKISSNDMARLAAYHMYKMGWSISEAAYVEFGRQDVFGSLDEFVEAMPPHVQALHVYQD